MLRSSDAVLAAQVSLTMPGRSGPVLWSSWQTVVCRVSAPTAAPGQSTSQRSTYCRGAAPEYGDVAYDEDVGAGKIPINELVVGQVYQGTVVSFLFLLQVTKAQRYVPVHRPLVSMP